MTAYDVILRMLGKRRGAHDLAVEINDALYDARCLMADPDGPLRVELDDRGRNRTHETELAPGVRCEWNNDTLTAVEFERGTW